MAVSAAIVAAVVAPVSSSTPSSALAVKCTLCAGGEYHPLTPSRIFDSRHTTDFPDGINDVAPLGAKPMNLAAQSSSFNIQLLGVGDDPIPSNGSDVLAVLVSIAIIDPTYPGWLGGYPAGEIPTTPSAILNFDGHQLVSNMAIVRPGVDGKLTIRIYGINGGTANIAVDVFGWFSTSGYDAGTPFDANAIDGNQSDERGGRLVPVSPGRILDTRPSKGGAGPLTTGETRELQILGADTTAAPLVTDIVPDDSNVVGVLLNLVAIAPTSSTYLSVLPEAPVGRPGTANVNVAPRQVKANLVAVPVGADGKVRIYNYSGDTNVVADVMGYFLKGAAETTRAGRIIPLSSPFRVFDTRKPEFGAVALGPGQAEAWSFANFAASVTVSVNGVPTSVGNQSALIGNLTNATLTRLYPSVPVNGYLTAYPADGSPRPTSANLNSAEGTPVPNMAILKYGTAQQVNVFNYAGYSHYVLDVSAVVLAD